ncbi:DUF3616 domain-containing protein [Microvirga sp. VF16]|uniref:DUF3616 domain-containing protein n=1 Tax=Microvirga sp. VF16 TaxID=2807101 RepID=UPI00193DC6A5|nr:DUF3616 domain-containing protein [Microvirga sp. VF16]QRM35397.1 DUF3616 domain-containing protein [Microvirga sp. VF16]
MTNRAGHALLILASTCSLMYVFPFWVAPASAQQGQSEIVIEGEFKGKEGDPAGDLSGIACRVERNGHTCLVVNDESPFAQLAKLRDRRLTSDRTVDLIENLGARLADNIPPAGTFGSEAKARPVLSTRCPDRPLNKDFDEFDGEGVAYTPTVSGGFFYIVGSHACGRGNPTRRRSTHLLARFRIDESGALAEPAELTWRLGEALLKADQVSANYGLLLTEEQKGLDIEGIAALSDDDLVLGLRAPLLGDSDAVILRVRASELFSAAPEQSPSVRVARVSLGGKAGIRDLATLPDGRLLILSGSPQQQPDIPQEIFIVTPSDQPVWEVKPALAKITPPRPEAKAEGIAVLGVAGRTVSLLVLFENIKKDKPVEYAIELP